MRFGWLGFHAEGVPALQALLADGAPIRGVVTLRPDLAAKRSGGADYRPICQEHDVPLHYVANINDAQATGILCEMAADVVFVIGWHQIVRADALRLASVGMIGAHASLLPHNRGSAPINWALIRGAARTGNTLFWLAESVDAGDIIDQTAFPITPYDTCATLYEKVAASNRAMLLRLWRKLVAGERPSQPQPAVDEPVLPRRRPADGIVDWWQSNKRIYDFIRALTRPYPGAFSAIAGREFRLWRSALLPIPLDGAAAAPPGTVLGPMVSPVPDACGQVVSCGTGAIALLEVEAQDGSILRGPALSEQRWEGLRWGHE